MGGKAGYENPIVDSLTGAINHAHVHVQLAKSSNKVAFCFNFCLQFGELYTGDNKAKSRSIKLISILS